MNRVLKNPGGRSLRNSILFFILGLISFGLISCSAVDTGTITNKGHENAYWYTTTTCAGYSSKGICTVWIPQTHYMPERWYFDLNDGKKTGWVNVSESTWSEYEVGDYFKPNAQAAMWHRELKDAREI